MKTGMITFSASMEITLSGDEIRTLLKAALNADTEYLTDLVVEKHGWVNQLCLRFCREKLGEVYYPIPEAWLGEKPDVNAQIRKKTITHHLTGEEAEQAYEILSQPLGGESKAISKLREAFGNALDTIRESEA